MQNFRFILIFCLLAPFGFLPLRWSQRIGQSLGLILIRYNKKRAHIARCNIRTAFPHMSHEEQEQLLKETAVESGKWFMESAYVWFRKPEYLCRKVTVTNPRLLDEAYKKQRGVVIVLPHLGNWELLNFYVPQHYPFGAMYKPVKSELFEKIIFNSRSRVGSSLFPTNPSGVRKALKALKNNTIVAILSDHLPSHEASVYAPFFNQPALTGKLTQRLVQSNHSEILLSTVLRKQNGEGFEITFYPVDGANVDDAILSATALNKSIEAAIIKAPSQYQWVYRRFAHPPEGTKDIYQ